MGKITMPKKQIDWETLFELTLGEDYTGHPCFTCEDRSRCRTRNRPPGCPIWASLEDAPELCEHVFAYDGPAMLGFGDGVWCKKCGLRLSARDARKIQPPDEEE